MAKQRKLSPERKVFINNLIEHYPPEDAADVQDMLKDLLRDTLQGMQEAAMDEKLGYSKYDCKNNETDYTESITAERPSPLPLGRSALISPTGKASLSPKL